MKRYTIKKIFQYTETVEVYAESETEAKRAADFKDGESNCDDHLVDCEVISEEDV